MGISNLFFFKSASISLIFPQAPQSGEKLLKRLLAIGALFPNSSVQNAKRCQHLRADELLDVFRAPGLNISPREPADVADEGVED